MQNIKCVFVLLFLFPISLAAQVLTGKVVDAKTNEPMPGVSITIKSTGKGTATDLKGEFSIGGVSKGKVTLMLSYLGYADLVKEVSIPGVVKIEMQPGDGKSMSVVTIVGTSKEGQGKALNQQRTADNIKNIISADQIGRFPDLNVAEALQRVPGVNIERDRGEGGVVQMRGAPPSFTTVNINGEQIPGTQNDGSRNQELSVIPVDQLSSMEVTKAITPDMDGDNIGGNVDLKTPTAKSLKWKGKLELGGGYNNIVQKVNFIGRASFNRRFFANDKVRDGRLGISFGYSHFETQNGRDRTQYSYPAAYTPVLNRGTGQLDSTTKVQPIFYRLRDLENLRRRVGASATVDFKFDNKNQLTFNYMYTQRYDKDREKRLQFDFGQGSLTVPNWFVESDGTITNNNTTVRRFIHPRIFDVKTNTFTLDGKHLLNKVAIDYTAFLSSADNLNDAGRTYDFRSSAFTAEMVNPNTDFTNVQARDKTQDVHNPFFVNTFRNFVDRADIIKARNLAFKLNISVPYKLSGYDALFKFGGKVRQINNERDRDFSEYEFLNNGYINEGALFASVIGNREDQQFFRNRIRFGPTMSFERTDAFISKAFAERPSVFISDPIALLQQRPAWFYDAQENVAAIYAMTKVQINKLMILAGLRYEHTGLNNTTASLIERSPTTGIDSLHAKDSNTRVNYSFVLPNVHFKYAFSKNTNLRAAFTTSFARPNFTDVMPRENVNIQNQTVDLGNPAVRAPRSVNIDLLVEHYFKNVGILSGGLFYKRIQNFIFTRSFGTERIVRKPDPLNPGSFIEELQTFTAVQPQNGEVANVFGAEVNIQYNIDKGLFKGLGVIANYTFTSSNASTFERKDIRLPGQAQHTYNLALGYDYKKFSVKAMFNYNGSVIRSLGPDAVTIGRDALNKITVNTKGDFDTWRAARYQLDVSASYRINNHFRVYCEFVNLTNRPEAEYLGDIKTNNRSRPVNIEYYDWWNRFGVAYSF
jgi:TonB-dependent receptor